MELENSLDSGLDRGSKRYGTIKNEDSEPLRKPQISEDGGKQSTTENASPNDHETCDIPGCSKDTVKWCNKCGDASCENHLCATHGGGK